jgi:hypothetical protein
MLGLAVLARRLRGLYRLARYRLTRRWPRYRYAPMDGGRPCTSGEMKAALQLVQSWRRKGESADEPDYSRRAR